MRSRFFHRYAVLLAVFSLVGPLSAAETPAKRPRVLILGDSISMGYTPLVRKNLQNVAEVSRPNENCQHTAYGLAKIDKWLGTEKWDVIHFNWGIWDTHYLDASNKLIRDEANLKGNWHLRHTDQQYRENLTKLVKRLEKANARLVWASTTPMMWRTGEHFEHIKQFNRVAEETMRVRGIAIDDLYGLVLPHVEEWQTADKVHFNAKGNEELAKRVSESIRQALGQEKR